MTDWREELIEKMAKAALESDASFNWGAVSAVWEASRKTYLREARAALAVAEPVIREQADNILREEIARLQGLLREAHVKMEANNLWSNLRHRVAAVIRETGE